MIPLLDWLQGLHLSAFPGWLLVLLAAVVPVFIVWLILQLVAGLSTYIERKVAADIQRREGPNQCNVGSFLGPVLREAIERGKRPEAGRGHRLAGRALGLALPAIDLLDKVLGRWAPGVLIFLADGIKLIMKEDLVPASADGPLFRMAPVIVLCSAFAAAAAMPFSDRFYIADFSIGIFYIAAITSIEAIGILMAGWASNNKWALLGGMRSAAQIVSYELPVGLAILTGILLSGTMSMQGITQGQFGPAGWQQGWFWQWNVFSSPFMLILFPVYFLGALAECNRTPFDIPEAESELVAGYHTEYSGMRFAFFFMAEYIMMCVTSAIAVTLFWGGWSTGIGALESAPWWAHGGDPANGFYWWASLVHLGVFLTKTYALVFVMMWIRWTIPRFRVDQMMILCWKKLIPIGLFCFTGVALWKLLRPLAAARAGGADNLANLTGALSLLVALAVSGFLAWWFFVKQFTGEEQAARKLIEDANFAAPSGHGFG